jgi:hypothetical protein
MTGLEEVARGIGGMVLVGGALPVFCKLTGKLMDTDIPAFLGAIIAVGVLVGQISLGAILIAPLPSDEPGNHHFRCEKRINGLWLPGKSCTCGYDEMKRLTDKMERLQKESQRN